MRIAVLVKQVPAFEAMALGPDGRLVREGLPLEMNPYCRRAVSKGAELAGATSGSCTVITLGPPSAEDCLREAVAWGCDEGVLVSDLAFAGSDTLATARALAAALDVLGPFDLVLAGRNSVDADTGQVGPQVAELCGLSFATGVKELVIGEGVARVRCEEDDGYSDRIVALPAVLSCAERLCEPAKVDPEGRAAVATERIRTLHASDLGPGPWGQDASGTYVGEVRVLEISRDRRILTGPVADQVAEAVRVLEARNALDDDEAFVARKAAATAENVRENGTAGGGRVVAVAVEPGRDGIARELLGAAASLAAEIGGRVVAITQDAAGRPELTDLSSWGADAVVAFEGAGCEDDVAGALVDWAMTSWPWAILFPSTAWGREVAGRAAASLGAGLTGDAVELEVSTTASTGESQLLAWKPAFGGRLVAAIYCSTPTQMATVRSGVLPLAVPRPAREIEMTTSAVARRGRVVVASSSRDDDIDVLARARTVVGVGASVPPDEYDLIRELAHVLRAEMSATRKVTDKGWMPRARQVGITGRSIAPRLYVAIGLSGKFNHAVGVRAAGTVLAVNSDPEALIWDHADIGIVGDWREVVPALVTALETRT